MTKLGIGSYSYAWAIGVAGYPAPSPPMNYSAFLQRSAELGVKLVQIADNLPLHTLKSPELDALFTAAQQLDLAIEVGTRGIQPDHLRRYLHIAQRCQSSILRVVIDTEEHHPEPPEIVSIIKDILPEYEQAGITLALENHDRFPAKTLAWIIDALASPYVGICLDTVNSFGALEGPMVVVDTLGPYVVNLHVKDFVMRRADHNMGFMLTGTPAGAGMLDVAWLLGRLNEFGRDYNAILELWPPPEADITQTISKEDAWVVASIDYLHTLISK